MGDFNQIIIFGKNVKGSTPETWQKAIEALKKYGMESVYMGAPLSISEDRVWIIKGSMSGYAKMIGDPEWPMNTIMTDTRSIVCWTP